VEVEEEEVHSMYGRCANVARPWKELSYSKPIRWYVGGMDTGASREFRSMSCLPKMELDMKVEGCLVTVLLVSMDWLAEIKELSPSKETSWGSMVGE
jgi:hypothetical protein